VSISLGQKSLAFRSPPCSATAVPGLMEGLGKMPWQHRPTGNRAFADRCSSTASNTYIEANTVLSVSCFNTELEELEL